MKMVNWLWKKKESKEEEDVNEEELKKKGFNPEGLEVEEVAEDQIINTFDKDYEGFISPSPQEAQELVAAFK
ncbi:MAG: hypothetical protein KDD45_02940 [Bdellovibrionales bacterium]|nr:hypothetical protein [Bdellovibrionales bacterium]